VLGAEPEWLSDRLVPAVVGFATAVALAVIKGALNARAKASEELRGRRLEAYPAIWRETALFYRDASSTKLTWQDLEGIQLEFRRWYFTTGGLFLSRRSTNRLNDVQELLSKYLARGRDPSNAEVDDGTYTAITETCSAFRTALTEDLDTRRQRSFVWSLSRFVWHRLQRHKAKRLIKTAGTEHMRYPPAQLEL
jgi:hypothetical protein